MNTAKPMTLQLSNKLSKVTVTPVVVDKDTGDVVSKGTPQEVTLEEFATLLSPYLPPVGT